MVWAENCSLLCVMPKNIRQYCAHAATHASTPESVCQVVRQPLCTTAGAAGAARFPTAVVKLACYTSVDSCSKETMSQMDSNSLLLTDMAKTRLACCHLPLFLVPQFDSE